MSEHITTALARTLRELGCKLVEPSSAGGAPLVAGPFWPEAVRLDVAIMWVLTSSVAVEWRTLDEAEAKP